MIEPYDGLVDILKTASLVSFSSCCLTGSSAASISRAGIDIALNAPVIFLAAWDWICCSDDS